MIKPNKIYAIRNKETKDTGTFILIEDKEKIEEWKKNLIKMKEELKENEEHFNLQLKTYEEVTNKNKDFTKEDKKKIKEKMEYIKKLIKTIKNKTTEMHKLEIVTIKEEKDKHIIEKVCNMEEFIPNWNEI